MLQVVLWFSFLAFVIIFILVAFKRSICNRNNSYPQDPCDSLLAAFPVNAAVRCGHCAIVQLATVAGFGLVAPTVGLGAQLSRLLLYWVILPPELPPFDARVKVSRGCFQSGGAIRDTVSTYQFPADHQAEGSAALRIYHQSVDTWVVIDILERVKEDDVEPLGGFAATTS